MLKDRWPVARKTSGSVPHKVKRRVVKDLTIRSVCIAHNGSFEGAVVTMGCPKGSMPEQM